VAPEKYGETFHNPTRSAGRAVNYDQSRLKPEVLAFRSYLLSINNS
jgi:hypothetical protein